MATLIVPKLELEYPTLGPAIKDFIEERLTFGPGSLSGQPAVLDDEKTAALYRAYELWPQGHELAGRRRFHRAGIEWAKGKAKALALDTPIPTPTGWTTMGELRPGDFVFDEAGLPVRVVAVSEVFHDHACYRVRFRDGSSMVADAGHRWYTETLGDRRRKPGGVRTNYEGSVKTTEQIAATLTRKDGASRHRIPVPAPLQLPHRDLPVDPWILGMWLGDGRTDDAEFSMHPGDHAHFLERVAAANYFAAPPKIDSRTGTYAVRVSMSPIGRGGRRSPTLTGALRDLGVLGDKHVPTGYLRASIEQRLELLRGLMDSDGTIDAQGSSSFTNTNRALADAVYELLCSLGTKPTIREVRSPGRPAWKVQVHVHAPLEIFSLPRKLGRMQAAPSRTPMSRNRHITSVERVPSVPTVCIAVDSPSHLFLAGRAMVPTHNTEFAAWVAIAELHPEAPVRCDGFDAYGNPVGRPVRSPYIPMMAASEEQVSDLAYFVAKSMLEEIDDSHYFDIGLDRILRMDSRGRADGRMLPVAGAPNSRDGALTTFQNFDEPHRLYLPTARQAHETMTQNLTKRPMEDPWSLYTSTAGQPGQNSVQEDLREEAEEIEDGTRTSSDLFFFSRWASVKNHPKIDTVERRVEAVREARGPVPEYGPGQLLRIAQDYDRKGADRAYWERTQLNRWRRAEAQAFDLRELEKIGAFRQGRSIPKGADVTVGFDGARRRDSTGFVITDIRTGLQELVAGWERPKGLGPEDLWEIPEDEVNEAWQTIHKRWKVYLGYYDPPFWTDTIGKWAGKQPEKVVEWWTNRHKLMAYTLRAYKEALQGKAARIGGAGLYHDDMVRHFGQAGQKALQIKDDEGKPLYVLQKLDGRRDLPFDYVMASILSWKACLDARKKGALEQQNVPVMVPIRVR